MNRQNLRTIVRGAYDIQKLRIMAGNRIVGNFKAKLGQQPGTKEDDMEADAKAILAAIRKAYKKITDGVKTFPRQSTFKGDEVISDYTELCLVAQYVELETQETQHFRRLGNILKEYPIYVTFLEPLKGVGPAMAGCIISEIDITRARYASSIWKYCGMDVARDGAGRSKRKDHLEQVAYTDREGNAATRIGITFNPFIKTKLLGVLGSSFLKVGIEKSPYARIYYDYKHRLENHEKYGTQHDGVKDENGKVQVSKGRRHNMANRYMIKRFLADLYVAWRTLESLPVAPDYHEAKLGHKHNEAA